MPSIRVEMTRDITVDLCEPEGVKVGQQIAQCECGRVAGRFLGADSWVECACGVRFNCNYSWLGRMV